MSFFLKKKVETIIIANNLWMSETAGGDCGWWCVGCHGC